MNQILNPLKARSEIYFQEDWNLTPAGRDNLLEYWSHVHFEGDTKWGQELWTLFIELDKLPEPHQRVYLANIYFLSPKAPFHFFRPGQKFELCIGSLLSG